MPSARSLRSLCAMVMLAWGAVSGLPADGPTLPTPPGWKAETIPFPLEFAPELTYHGREELRFAPGMFDPAADGYWSYVFLWWIEGEIPFDDERLGRELTDYFQGLAEAVAQDKGVPPPAATYAARVRTLRDPLSGEERLVGHARAYDAFAADAPVEVNIRGKLQPCAGPGRTAVIFELSPRPFSDPIWKELGRVRQGLGCPP